MRKVYLFIALALLIALLGWPAASPALASPGLSVGHIGGKGLAPEVSPGESYTQTLVVTLGQGDPATDVLIEVLGYAQSAEGGVQPLSPEEDKSPYSARSFITPATITLHVEPGETKRTDITVTIPPDVGSGGRYAILRFSTVPGKEGTVKIVSVIVLPMRFTIKDSQLTHQGRITEVTTGKAVSGQPVEILTTFQNTGNHHFKIEGQIEIRNGQNKLIDTLPISTSSPVPEGTKRFTTTFISQGELALGVYSVKSRLMLEDGTLLDEASGSFEVEKPYVPPPPPISIALMPSIASVLETTDGRISISFPQGAVISQAEVSLENYPLEQLSAPPAGFIPATTCFRVDGLTGLLAEEATVTVKYTPADLERAGPSEKDASKLRLARWDRAQRQWSVLETKVDTGATTLSTTTNRLSIWAVMVASSVAPSAPPVASPVLPVPPAPSVAPPASPAPPAPSVAPPNWMVIGGVAAGVLIIALLIYFLARRRAY